MTFTQEIEQHNKLIKDLKAENRLLGERCNQLLKDKGELTDKIEKMKKYIKACWIEENLNDYSSYITNSSEEFRDFVKELNEEIRNGR